MSLRQRLVPLPRRTMSPLQWKKSVTPRPCRLRPALVAAGLALTLGLPVASAQNQKPGYVQRLRLPHRADTLGIPRGVHADLNTNEVFVCDFRFNRIVIFDSEGLFRYQITGGDLFRAPRDVAVGPRGRIVVLAIRFEQRGLLELDFDGRFLRAFELTGLTGEGLVTPVLSSLALSPDGRRLYVADQANKRLWMATREGQVIGSVDLTPDRTDKEAAETLLGHVDVYGDTVLMAIPTDGWIRLYDLDGKDRGWVGVKGTSPCQTAFPVAGSIDAGGNVVIIDQQRAVGMIWDPGENKCLLEFSGIGRSPGALYMPSDITLDSSGRLYVSQGFEGRVQAFQHSVGAVEPGPAADDEAGSESSVTAP